MSKQKLTPWFTNNVPPARHGVYLAMPHKIEGSTIFYAFFGPNGWGRGCATAQEADESRFGARPDFYHVNGAWRGLAHPPKAKP